jgi:peroxisome-assembly ATPase
MPPLVNSTGLTITNPLIQYRSLIRLGRIDNDPAQHRLALKLQDLYHQLKDYEPQLEYSDRLEQIGRAIRGSADLKESQHAASRSIISSLFRKSPNPSSTSLIRSLTSRESALSIQSPKGLLIHGEVGRGKTMLLNLLADSLPTEKKRRFHFNTFMLEIFRRLEETRRERLALSLHSPDMAYEHSILSLARDFILKSPIIFLDEFQLPDRAASKLLSSLLTSFFHLGGVLLATSNRLPEELAKASGIDFVAPEESMSRVISRKLGLGQSMSSAVRPGAPPGASDFAQFLEVLKARCDVWEMEGELDWRRHELMSSPTRSSTSSSDLDSAHSSVSSDSHNSALSSQGDNASSTSTSDTSTTSLQETGVPSYYYLSSTPFPIGDSEWEQSITLILSSGERLCLSDIPWKSGSFHVYGRTIQVPMQHSGVTKWSFLGLCGTNLGPADYITLASNFDTLILVDVPVLTVLMKNEARRFITLLDALYEAGCRLLIHAAAPPDDLFFPEAKGGPDRTLQTESDDDLVYQEMYSEVYQDSTSPFRPNVSAYQDGNERASESTSAYGTSQPLRSVLADEDADFGPVYRNGRGVGAARDERHHEAQPSSGRGPDFTQAHISLVGEDERFAYKRARSRLWEMCGERWWSREDFWRPVEPKNRHWERGKLKPVIIPGIQRDTDDASLFRHGASPFRTVQGPPPQFDFTHFWRMMTWGKKAGAWGRGELKDAATSEEAKKR